MAILSYIDIFLNTCIQEREVAKALEKAVGALPDGTIKAFLQSSLPVAAAQLLKNLQPEEPTLPKPRAKRAKTIRGAEDQEPQAPAAAAVPVEPTLLDSSLETTIEAILNGKAPKYTDDIGALVSRFPPAKDLLQHQVLTAYPAADGDSPDWNILITAAEKTLQACNALAGQATSREEALTTFGPALALLQKAAGLLMDTSRSNDGESSLDKWITLRALSSRALVCMDLVGKEIDSVNAAIDGGAPADVASRWWLRRAHGESRRDVLAGARTACAAAVSLCTSAQSREIENANIQGLAALAGHSMRVLAPYAAAGQMLVAAEAEPKEVSEDSAEARVYLALYLAAAEQGEKKIFIYLIPFYPPLQCCIIHICLCPAFQAAF